MRINIHFRIYEDASVNGCVLNVFVKVSVKSSLLCTLFFCSLCRQLHPPSLSKTTNSSNSSTNNRHLKNRMSLAAVQAVGCIAARIAYG